MADREDITQQIVAIELSMFLTVNDTATAACQQYPDDFLLHRRAQFAAWSLPTLTSYLADLQAAEYRHENLMRAKYARMEGLAERRSMNPLIDEIVQIATGWQRDMMARYPALMSGARPLTNAGSHAWITSFQTYARGEYETYSDGTLSLLYADMLAALERGANLSEVVYDYLARESGFASLEEAEQLHARRRRAARE